MLILYTSLCRIKNFCFYIYPMSLPYEPILFDTPVNLHLILEYLGFFIGFRYYIYLRKRQEDAISSAHRLSIIIGAVFGALLLSRVVAFFENPSVHAEHDWLSLANNKTIMGGLFGGLLGVELVKKIIGEKNASGDLFTLPIILGVSIGRMGCFLSGVNEFTYGKATTFFMGMNLGDGVQRHPIALYEICFLVVLFLYIKQKMNRKTGFVNGDCFKLFMVSYFTFRFFIEFLKPNSFFVLGLSSIQILCLICLCYYYKFIVQLFINARK